MNSVLSKNVSVIRLFEKKVYDNIKILKEEMPQR